MNSKNKKSKYHNSIQNFIVTLFIRFYRTSTDLKYHNLRQNRNTIMIYHNIFKIGKFNCELYF